MRKPTLHERISIKNILICYGVPSSELVTEQSFNKLIHYWNLFFPYKSIADYAKIRNQANYRWTK